MMRLTGKILIADDDRELRLGVTELLGQLGLEVLEAETGPDALWIARQRIVDAMILDCHMPGCTGLEVLTAVRLELQTPCIVYTGRPTQALEEAALRAGAWAFLHKPVEPARLRSEVVRAIEHAHETRAGQG